METKTTTGSVSLRLLIIGGLILMLLIPQAMISSLVPERENRKREAVAEVTSKWAKAQLLGGPVLTVPYDRKWRDAQGKQQVETAYLHLLPQDLEIVAKLAPLTKYRGIYRVIIYNASLSFRGGFAPPDLAALGLNADDVHWRAAVVSVGISDVRGINENFALDWAGQTRSFGPGIANNGLFNAGVSAPVPLNGASAAARSAFSFSISLKGSEELYFLPLGRTTKVHVASAWTNPSFDGAFLPNPPAKIGAHGFQADWQVLEMNRGYPQQWTGEAETDDVRASAFGLKLISPVDDYTNTDRATKYAVLFITLTFMIFFLVEVFTKKRIHPIQYLLVGLTLCLFYVLLLSISEHLGFATAYLIAAAGVVGLVAYYAAGSIGGRAAAPATAGTLLALYAFLYVLLQNQDYALLLGSVGLFLIMAAVMFLSRKVDWYGLEGRKAQAPAGPEEG